MLCGKLTSKFFMDNNNLNNYNKHDFIFIYFLTHHSSVFRTCAIVQIFSYWCKHILLIKYVDIVLIIINVQLYNNYIKMTIGTLSLKLSYCSIIILSKAIIIQSINELDTYGLKLSFLLFYLTFAGALPSRNCMG